MPRKRGTDETTSQSTKPASWQVAGYRDERKMYRTMVFGLNQTFPSASKVPGLNFFSTENPREGI
jgi:hypothetical protein